MEFAFKYGIWEFPIHDLTPETQILAAKGYGADLNFLCILKRPVINIFDRKIMICVFESVSHENVEWENALNLCAAHPF